MIVRILENGQFGGFFTREVSPDWTTTQVIENAGPHSIWNGSNWILNQNAADAVAVQAILDALQRTVCDLRHKAMCIAIEKQGDEAYINAQRELYEIKAELAEMAVLPSDIQASWESEAAELAMSFGLPSLTVEEFKLIILGKFTWGDNYYKREATPRIERARTKIQTLAEEFRIDEAHQALIIMPGVIDPVSGESALQQLVALGDLN